MSYLSEVIVIFRNVFTDFFPTVICFISQSFFLFLVVFFFFFLLLFYECKHFFFKFLKDTNFIGAFLKAVF